MKGIFFDLRLIRKSYVNKLNEKFEKKKLQKEFFYLRIFEQTICLLGIIIQIYHEISLLLISIFVLLHTMKLKRA